jgi:MSHA biogenesis protein MshM
MWLRHWNLKRDPHVEGGGPFVPVPGHCAAVEQIVQSVETGQRFVRLVASAGLGKSRVLAEVLAHLRDPTRKVGLVRAPCESQTLLSDLTEALGLRPLPCSGHEEKWRRLADAVRLCHWQALGVVLAIDDAQLLGEQARRNLERASHLVANADSKLTIVEVSRDEGTLGAGLSCSDWSVLVRLAPLTRSEAEQYLGGKLASVGRSEPAFTPRALARLHALACGNPRGLDRLARQTLVAGARQGAELVTLEIAEAAAGQFAVVDSDSGV